VDDIGEGDGWVVDGVSDVLLLRIVGFGWDPPGMAIDHDQDPSPLLEDPVGGSTWLMHRGWLGRLG
jgi:hypothetical protein